MPFPQTPTSSDRAQLFLGFCFAALCLVLGIGIAWALPREASREDSTAGATNHRPGLPSETAVEAPAVEAPATEVAATEVTALEEVVEPPPSSVEANVAQEEVGVPVPAQAAPVETPNEDLHPIRSIERGMVAYLRCDGAQQLPGPYPCPRDTNIERQVWSILESLPRCATPPLGPASGDVRIGFVNGGAVEITATTRGEAASGAFDADLVARCLRPQLSPLRISYPHRKVVVSFRVQAR